MSAFVSRESELAQLSSIFDRAMAGGPPVAFVTGEAGSGKTALLSAFAESTQTARTDVVFAVGDCNAQTGIGDPYLPFREVLGQLTGDVEPKLSEGRISEENASRLSRLMEASGRALVQHAPDLVDLLVPGGALLTRLGRGALLRLPWARRLSEISEGRMARGADAGGLEQSHVFQQVTSLLGALSAERPLVLVLDDLHWVDPASATLLFHLARRLEGRRLLVLGAFRPADVALGRGDDRHPLDPVLTELRRYHGDIVVRVGEDEGDGRRFVDALVTAEAPGMDDGFRDELHRHTGGHPLFTVELLRHLKETDGLAVDESGRWRAAGPVDWGALPARVDGVVEERAQRLDPEQRELLAVASVEGEEFTAEVLAAALSREPREVVRELSGPLEKRHGLVRALGFRRTDGQRLTVYRFRHNLFQTWFYRQLDPVERSYLHEDVGRSLEALHHADLEAVAVRLARHFAEADQPEAAVRYLLMAGDRARAAFANDDAALRYAEAARIVDGAGARLDEKLARDARARIEEALGDLAELSGRHLEALRHYHAATADLDPADDRVRYGRLLRKQAKPLEIRSQTEEAAIRLHEAEAALGEPPGEEVDRWWDEWLRILVERVWVNYWRGGTREMEEAMSRARPVVERRGNPLHKARFYGCESLFGLRVDRFHPSDPTLRAARRGLEASRQGGSQAELAMGHFQVGFAYLWRLDLELADPHLDSARTIAETLGDTTLLARALVYISVLLRLKGDLEGTERAAERARRVAEAAGLREYIGTVHAQRAWIALRYGNEAQARSEAMAALAEWDRLPFPYPIRTLGLLPLLAAETRAGRCAEAVEIARQLLQPPLVRLPDPLWRRLQDAVDAGEELARAEAALARALASARELNYL